MSEQPAEFVFVEQKELPSLCAKCAEPTRVLEDFVFRTCNVCVQERNVQIPFCADCFNGHSGKAASKLCSWCGYGVCYNHMIHGHADEYFCSNQCILAVASKLIDVVANREREKNKENE